jgi:hypothetical protein
VDPVPDMHVLQDATPYLPMRISADGSSADPSPPPMPVAIMHLMVVRSGWGLGVGKPIVVPRPLVHIPAHIHRRGAAINVGGKIVKSSATSAAIVTAVAGMLMSMLGGGRMVVSVDPAATVMAAGSVADSGLDEDNDPAAPAISEAAASSMLEKGKHNKSGTKDIGIQA